MRTANVPTTPRRSSRVPTAVPILVTSLDGKHFSEVCETLVVNAHGCAMLSPIKFDNGVPLHFHSKDGREATAHVVSCQPMGTDSRSWRLGTRLDRPENFWGLNDCPKDWPTTVAVQAGSKVVSRRLSEEAAQRREALLERVNKELETQVKRAIAESVRPLEEEIASLKERLARREANPSRFDVSLSSIPAELEQQLESRLRKDLGPRVLDEARQQSAQLLAAANATITHKTNEGYESFLRRVGEELRVVEKRARETSAYISETADQQLRRGLKDLQEKLVESGNSLKQLSEQLLEYLKENLDEEHSARRGDLEQLRTSLQAESARLGEHIESFDGRMAKLDESVRSLESGLDQRLSYMASNTVKDARSQLESVANSVREELTSKSVKALAAQLDEASGNMKVIQKGIVASFSDTLKSQASDALQEFEQSTQELARLSVERCRQTLTRALNALIKGVSEEFQPAGESRGQA
ncbi:MAG TPA: hypothetical protein VEH30_11300 [Terriglobales bacterium]|nr:hypothetical protein [Terriglobales bacterium]